MRQNHLRRETETTLLESETKRHKKTVDFRKKTVFWEKDFQKMRWDMYIFSLRFRHSTQYTLVRRKPMFCGCCVGCIFFDGRWKMHTGKLSFYTKWKYPKDTINCVYFERNSQMHNTKTTSQFARNNEKNSFGCNIGLYFVLLTCFVEEEAERWKSILLHYNTQVIGQSLK